MTRIPFKPARKSKPKNIETICSYCKNSTLVNFKPDGKKDIFCKENPVCQDNHFSYIKFCKESEQERSPAALKLFQEQRPQSLMKSIANPQKATEEVKPEVTEEVKPEVTEEVTTEAVKADDKAEVQELIHKYQKLEAQLDTMVSNEKYDELEAKLKKTETSHVIYQDKLKIEQEKTQLLSKDIEETRKSANLKIIQGMITIFEELYSTYENTPLDESSKKGFSMAIKNFNTFLKDQSVEFIPTAIDKTFDIDLHEAVKQTEDPNFGDNVVIEEIQRGYKFNGQVVRPSKVAVNKNTIRSSIDIK